MERPQRRYKMDTDTRYWEKWLLTDFIKIYKENPCLWRVKSKEYVNKHLKNKAYDKLVKLCKTKFPESNRNFVSKKIQSVRGAFRKEFKKVNKSIGSWSSADDVYAPSLWYYDLLLFLVDQESVIPNIESATVQQRTEGITKWDASNYSDDGQENQNVSSLPNTSSTKRSSSSSTQESASSTQKNISSTEQKVSNLNNNKRKRATFVEQTRDFMKLCSESITEKTDLNEFEATGIAISRKLQKMDPIQAIYADSIINETLKQGLLKNLTGDTILCKKL